MTWLPVSGARASAFERAFALRPNLFEAWREFATLFWTRRLLDPALLELCRLRIGRMHGAALPDLCPEMRAARGALDARRAAEIDAWWRSDAFGEVERTCLGFAEQFVLDPHEISDESAAAVVAALGDAGTVAFVEALAILDGFSRFARILGLAEGGAAARAGGTP